MRLAGTWCCFLDFCARLKGRSVRELQTTNTDSGLSEHVIRDVLSRVEVPHVCGRSRTRIVSILDAPAPGADAHPAMARELWAKHSPRRYRASVGRSVSGRSNAASNSGFAHAHIDGFPHAFQAFANEHC